MQNPDIETVLTEVIDLGSSPEERLRLEYRSSPAASWDLKAISGKPDVLHRLKEVFQDRTFVEQFGIKGTSAFIRFDDAYVAGQMERLLNGGSRPAIPSPFRGTRAVVQFIDPNTTKALHLGHMYEAILGNALAALLTSRGADVKRYCFVSDISRSVCEAMAGFDMFGDGKRPEQLGEKSDHMVGRLYAQYAAQYYQLHPEEADNEDPVRRETDLVGDSADEYMRRYQTGEAEARTLWRTVRDWVLEGQLATLSRMNIGLDVIQFGSDTDPDIETLIARGLERGALEREPSGAVVFHSGKEEYRTVVIARPDGFPTEHTRQMAQMMSVFPTCSNLDRYYTFMGMEWKPAWTLYENILRGIGESSYHDIVVPICHGMVMVDGSKMKSSKGAVVLADELLDQIEGAREVQSLAQRTGSRISAASVASIVAKSFFLSRKMAKDLNFSWEQVLSQPDNPGWDIASAWCTLHSPDNISVTASRDSDIARTFFFRSFDLDRALDHAAAEIDLSSGSKFLHRLARTVSNSDLGAQSAKVAHSVMQRGLASFGL